MQGAHATCGEVGLPIQLWLPVYSASFNSESKFVSAGRWEGNRR